jgi:hypothetical protein
MDTTWFAVDVAGQVGMFETGENGHAPEGEENDISEKLWELRTGTDSAEGWVPENLCRITGVYLFGYLEDYDPIGTYTRLVVPPTPLHIDQLPPEPRRRCRTMRFPVHFDQTDQLQPLDYFPCIYWYEDRIAYLSSDGKTVKPLPGQEAKFAEFVREFRRNNPEEADGLIFDGPTR